MNFDLDKPAIDYIIQTGECISTNDILNSDATSCLPEGCSMQSLICTPIMANNEVRGIIHLDSLKKKAFDKDDLELTISIGVATFPTDANRNSGLIEAADSALYRAKRAGRNRVDLYYNTN